MQLINSSLDKPVKNLWDEDFKYLVVEFGSENLEPLKQKDISLVQQKRKNWWWC